MTEPTEPKVDKTKFTPRNVAKYAVKTAIKLQVKDYAKTLIAEHTSFEEDDTTVIIGAYVVGWWVSETLSPYTDMAVDKTADFASKRMADRKSKRQAKKDAKKETPQED